VFFLLKQYRNDNIINILCHIFRKSKEIIRKRAHKKYEKNIKNTFYINRFT